MYLTKVKIVKHLALTNQITVFLNNITIVFLFTSQRVSCNLVSLTSPTLSGR